MKTISPGNGTVADCLEIPSIASYWQEQYRSEPYYSREFTFTDYLPAYVLGSEYYNSATSFETAEEELSNRWQETKGRSRLKWAQARNAVRAGWYHLKRVKIADSLPLTRFSGMPGGYTGNKRLQYERIFGPYREDDYRSPSHCPEDRRAMVAEIKVSAAATALGGYLVRYASGVYPTRELEEYQPLFETIREWDPHLPRGH